MVVLGGSLLEQHRRPVLPLAAVVIALERSMFLCLLRRAKRSVGVSMCSAGR